MRLSNRTLSIYLSIYLFLCLLMANSAYAAPIINRNTTYYDISGLTSHELRRQMAKKGPRTQLTPRRYAMTKWKIYHDIDYVDAAYGCKVHNVNITVDIQFIYPRWVNREEAHPQVRARWDGFYRALLEYEEMHANNGIEAAEEVEEELISLSSANNMRLATNYNCESFQRQINHRIQKIVLDRIRYDTVLDVMTDYGDGKGVWLP